MWIRSENRNEYYKLLDEEHRGNKQWHLTVGVQNPSQVTYLGVRSIQTVIKNEKNSLVVRYLKLSIKEERAHLEGGARLGEQTRQLRLEELAEEKDVLYGVILKPEKRILHYGIFLKEYPSFQSGFDEFNRKISTTQK